MKRAKGKIINVWNICFWAKKIKGGREEELAHRVLEGRKVWGAMTKFWKENMICREVKRELFERVVIPTVIYGSETWSLIKCTKEDKNRSI